MLSCSNAVFVSRCYDLFALIDSISICINMQQVNIENQALIASDHDKTHSFPHELKVSEVCVASRMGFIWKLCGILSVQLILTSFIVSSVLFTPIMRFYINENGWLVTVGYLLCVITILALMAKRTESPYNFILLTAFTCAVVYTAAVVVTYHDQLAVLQAFIQASCCGVVLTLYALLSKRDFLPFYAGLFSCITVLVLAGFFQMILGSTQSEMIISAACSIIFSLFVVYSIRRLMRKLSPKEYLVGVIDLYLDVINFFVLVIQSVLPLKYK